MMEKIYNKGLLVTDTFYLNLTEISGRDLIIKTLERKKLVSVYVECKD